MNRLKKTTFVQGNKIDCISLDEKGLCAKAEGDRHLRTCLVNKSNNKMFCAHRQLK